MSLFDFSKTSTSNPQSKSSGLFDFSSLSSAGSTPAPAKNTTPSVTQAVEKVSSSVFDKIGSFFKSAVVDPIIHPLGAAGSAVENLFSSSKPKPKGMEFPLLTGPSEEDITKKIADLEVAKKSVNATNKKSIDDYNARVSEIQKDIESHNQAQQAHNVLSKEYIPTPYDSPTKLLSRDLSHLFNEPIEEAGNALGSTKAFQDLANSSDAGDFLPSFTEDLFKHLQVGTKAISGATGGIIQPTMRDEPQDASTKLLSLFSEGLGMAATLGGIEGTAFKSLNAPKAIQDVFESYPKVVNLFNSLAKAVPAFATYGQLNPELSGVGNRLKTLGKDIATAIPFTALGLVDSKNLVVPASAALGFGMAKLGGASNEDAAVSATALGLLSLMGGTGKTSKEIITQRQAKGQLFDEAINTLNKYTETKLGTEPTTKEIKDAFKEAALKTHPDRGGDAKEFSAVSYAKDVLLGESKTTESVMEKQRAKDAKDEVKRTAEEFTKPVKEEKNPFKSEIVNIAKNFTAKAPGIEGINPKQETRLTPEEAEPMAKSAADQYWNHIIKPALKNGKATIIGADDFKDFFSKDYNDNNHPIYSRAAYLTFERALKENPNKTVVLTGGGPASGKTELLIKDLMRTDFNGVIYDSNMANYEGVSKQIEAIRNAGKNVAIYGVIPNLDQSRTFSIQRENKIGRGISDKTFARGHAGFPQVLEKLLKEGKIKPEEVNLLDTRETTSFEEALDKVMSEDYSKDPLALLQELGYNEKELEKTYAKENYNKETGKRSSVEERDDELRIRERSRDSSPQNRSDQVYANRKGNEGVLGKTQKETGQVKGRKHLSEVPINLQRVIDYKERLRLRGADPVLLNAIITPSGNRAYGVSVGEYMIFEKVVQQFTEDHEVFHQIFKNFDQMRLFKGFDKEALLTEAKDLYGDIPVDKLEEEMAKDFQQYVNDRESGKESTFFGKIKEFFERLYASLKRIFRNPKDIQEFYRTVYEGKSTEDTIMRKNASLDKFSEKAKTKGESDFRQEQYALAQFLQKTSMGEIFNDEGDLTLKTLTKLKGRSTVSKQFIEDLSNSGDIKQVERDLIRSMLETEPDTVNVPEFAERVKAELLPLTVKQPTGEFRGNTFYPTKYEGISLPDDLRGNVANYRENVYESPIQTSAGNIHFPSAYAKNNVENYFGHTRIEDMGPDSYKEGEFAPSPSTKGATRRVIEVQSDLYQKGNLERESDTFSVLNGDESVNKIGENEHTQRLKARKAEVAKLQQYNDPTAHFRMVREEVRKAAQDGKRKLQFPTGETAMKIEGLHEPYHWFNSEAVYGESYGRTTTRLEEKDLKVGAMINGHGGTWIITDVQGDGKFGAISKREVDKYGSIEETLRNAGDRAENFSISTKLDTNNPIYRFYEKDLGRYLKNNYGAKPVTDDKGVTWMEVNVDPAYADMPVPAFNEKPEDINQLRKMLEREQESLDIANANPEMHAQAYGPDRIEKYKERIADLKERIKLVKYPIFDVGNKMEELKKTLAYTEKRNGVEAFKKADAIIDKVRSIPKSKIELPSELKVIQDEISAANEIINDFETRMEEHPGKKLTLANAENKLESTEFSDEFDNEDTIREVKESYKEDKLRLQELKEQRKNLKAEFSKLRNDFYTKERDRVAINSLVAREERVKVLEEVGKILRKEGRERKYKINAIQEYFKLTDKEIKQLNKGNKDFRLMTDKDFNNFLQEIQGKAYEIKAHREAVLEIENTIHEMQLRKTENLRQALKMRELKNMSLNELNKFNDLLQTFQPNDEFLGKRQIQTAGLTDLGSIKTHREALKNLADEAGVPITDVNEVQPSWKDKFLNDVGLAKRNPLFKIMVENVNRETVAAAQRYHVIKEEFQDLMMDARKSRKRSIFDRLAPTDDLIYQFQEVSDGERAQLMKKMTPEEIKAALYIKQHFLEMRDYLLNQGTLERYVQNYITRMHRSVLEIIKTEGKGILSKDGFKAFVKELWDANKLQKINFKILEDKTGEVLPLEKFFKYSISRTGRLTPSKNVGRVFLEYVRLFEQKRQLDSFVPKLDIFTHVLTPQEKTKGGLIKNDTLNTFVKTWLNNKKGRVMDTKIASPGDPIDFAIRLGIAYTRLRDLGLNITVGWASNVGAQIATYIPLGGRKYVLGLGRMNLKQGKTILKKYEPIVGEKLRNQLKDVSKTTGEKTQELLYSNFGQGDRRGRSVFFLGLLTPEEFKTGDISLERLSKIKLEIARYHAVGEMKSLIGSTSIGAAAMQYKSWALPTAQSTISNLRGLRKVVQNSREENPFKSREVRELSRLTISTALVLLAAYEEYNNLKNKKDRNFLENLAYKSINDALSMIGALSPSLWTKVRVLQFIDDLATATTNIVAALATGTRTTKGEIDGLDLLKSAITPTLVKNLLGKDSEEEKLEDDLNVKIHTAQKKIDGLDPALVKKVQPLFDQAKELGFGTEEADALLADLTDNEYNVYKALKAKDVAENNLKNQDKILSIVKKANDLGFGTEEADKLVADSFPDTEQGDADYAAYTSIKNSLYGENNQKNESLGTWDKQSFLDHVSNIAEAVGTDPATLFNDILAGNGSWRVVGLKNGQIIVQRLSEAASQAIKKERGGATKEFKLDHAIPLEAGGNNGGDNLQLIPTGDESTPGTHGWNTTTENIIGKALGEGKITGAQAREYSIRFKATAGEPLSEKLQKEFKEKYNSQPLTPEEIENIINPQ